MSKIIIYVELRVYINKKLKVDGTFSLPTSFDQKISTHALDIANQANRQNADLSQNLNTVRSILDSLGTSNPSMEDINAALQANPQIMLNARNTAPVPPPRHRRNVPRVKSSDPLSSTDAMKLIMIEQTIAHLQKNNGTHEEGIFRIPGSKRDVDKLVKAFLMGSSQTSGVVSSESIGLGKVAAFL